MTMTSGGTVVVSADTVAFFSTSLSSPPAEKRIEGDGLAVDRRTQLLTRGNNLVGRWHGLWIPNGFDSTRLD